MTTESIKLLGAMSLLKGWSRIAYGWNKQLGTKGYYVLDGIVHLKSGHTMNLQYDWLAIDYDDAVLALGHKIADLQKG